MSKEKPIKDQSISLQPKFALGKDVSYQLIRSTEGRFGSSSTVLNDGLGEVLEISALQPALEMLAMLNENSGKGIIYKLRGVKIKLNK